VRIVHELTGSARVNKSLASHTGEHVRGNFSTKRSLPAKNALSAVLIVTVHLFLFSPTASSQPSTHSVRRGPNVRLKIISDSSFDEFRDAEPRVTHRLAALPTDIRGLYIRLNRKQCDGFNSNAIDDRSFIVLLDFGKPLLTAEMKESAATGSFLTNVDYVRGPPTDRSHGLFFTTTRSAILRSQRGETRATTADDQEAQYIKTILLDPTAKFRVFDVLSFSLPESTRASMLAFLDSTAVIEGTRCH
jgi:hypothetical protein